MPGTAIGLALTTLNARRADSKAHGLGPRFSICLTRQKCILPARGNMDSNDQFLPEYGVRVFLVEDNPEHAFIAVTVIRQLLGEASEVIVAENADEAVGLIGQFTDQDRPDLMLVDLRLPENGGFSVLCKPLSRGSLREELVRIGKLPPSSSPTRISSTH